MIADCLYVLFVVVVIVLGIYLSVHKKRGY